MAGWGICRQCRGRIWWGSSPYATGRAFPFDDDREQQPHFDTCSAQTWATDTWGQRHRLTACRVCGESVWWETTLNGKRRPMNVSLGDVADDVCHFDTCGGSPGGVSTVDYDRIWAAAHGRQADEPDSVASIAGVWLAELGLGWPVTLADVNAAFRRLSMTCHPDMGGTASDFIRIKLARDRLVELLAGLPA